MTRPPHITETDKPLRRKVAMAYRTALEIGQSERRAYDTAVAAYLEACPEAKDDPHAASARVAEMIATAVAVDPTWFWKNLPRG